MKRATSTIVLMLSTLCISQSTLASEDVTQLCADAANELTGATQFRLVDVNQPLTGRDIYLVTLDTRVGDSRYVCRVSNDRVTRLSAEEKKSDTVIASR